MSPAGRERLGTVLHNILEAARICELLVAPFMPAACQKTMNESWIGYRFAT